MQRRRARHGGAVRSPAERNSRTLPPRGSAQRLQASLWRLVQHPQQRPGRTGWAAFALLPVAYGVERHVNATRQLELRQPKTLSDTLRKRSRVMHKDREKFRAMTLDALRADIQKGADSGDGIPAEEVFARLRSKYEGTEQEQGSS
jgi:antitoxin ParD1/3/4